MPKVFDKRANATAYMVQKPAKAYDTLANIAERFKKTNGIDGWKDIALFNWGTAAPLEVRRILLEMGFAQASEMADDAGTVPDCKLYPVANSSILIPMVWKATDAKDLQLDQLHTIKLTRQRPATAISITKLDRWFIPGLETCALEYQLEGLKACADQVVLEVYGSNYSKCTDWNKGLGKYESRTKFPVFTKAGNEAAERGLFSVPDWKGETTTHHGILNAEHHKRVINVAFSPYTVHLRYFKAKADEAARIDLQPFWLRWDDTTTTPPVTPHFDETPARFGWKNNAAQDWGVIEVTDATGQRVHLAMLEEAKLAKGAQEVTWNKHYRPDAMNGKFTREYIDDTASVTSPPPPPPPPAPTPPYDLVLFKSCPYTVKITTGKRTLVADSAKVKWEIKHTTKLKRGLLIITDKANKVVFVKSLDSGLVGEGQHEFAWDGKYATGVKSSQAKGTDPADMSYEAIVQDMPYRMQIQAHTAENTLEGLALAATHTEVRLYVHPATQLPKSLAYEPYQAKPSLALGLGSSLPDPSKPPAEGTTTWYRYKLAEFGFHPGPVTDVPAADAEYKIALREFKRSVPADGTAVSPHFTRLALDGTNDEAENDATKTALKTIRDSDKRKWFGDPAKVNVNDNHPDIPDNDVSTSLSDASKSIILWVDDRQYYTSGDPAKDENNKDYLSGTPAAVTFGLKNYRGGMVNGDGRTDTDKTAIARPWIPLQVELQLLSQSNGLRDEVPLETDPARRQAMRQAIGPLRIDWTFDELPADLSIFDLTSTYTYPPNPAQLYYDKDFVRSRYFVAQALTQAPNKESYLRKDTGRNATYTNCKATLGGIRPSSIADYYQAAFGFNDLSLAPWQATADGTSESIATVIHDRLIPHQHKPTGAPPTVLHKNLIGIAGSYFHPSNIAGDGYRIRAEVQFAGFTDYSFPNLAVLKARYPVPPQAHTAAIRLWRRSSFRGHMCWGAASGNWGNIFINAFRSHYRTAHVYFVHEGGAATEFAISDVYNAATLSHQDKYKNIIKNNVSLAPLKDPAKMTLSADQIWPWGSQLDFGWGEPSPVNTPSNRLFDDWLNKDVCDETWRKFRAALLLALVNEIEKKGFLRGHLMVEFTASRAFFMEEYTCDAGAPHLYWYIENATGPGGRMVGRPCPAPGCGGGHVLSLSGTPRETRNALPLPAVGGALGATWLFWQGENTDRLKCVWVHEVGHHRHLEHAANGPGAKADLHDSRNNSKANWVGKAGATIAKATQWDRRCIMSYSDAWYQELGCLCGRCVLRNRGWKVTGLALPGSANADS